MKCYGYRINTEWSIIACLPFLIFFFFFFFGGGGFLIQTHMNVNFLASVRFAIIFRRADLSKQFYNESVGV